MRDRSGSRSLDYFWMAPHGMAFTHLDALCHVFWEGKMYNGFSDREVGRFGARRCAIDVTRDGIVSRGVLFDIPKLKNVRMAGTRRGHRCRATSMPPKSCHKVSVERGRRLADSHRTSSAPQDQGPMGSAARRTCQASTPHACNGSPIGKWRCSAATRSAM